MAFDSLWEVILEIEVRLRHFNDKYAEFYAGSVHYVDVTCILILVKIRVNYSQIPARLHPVHCLHS